MSEVIFLALPTVSAGEDPGGKKRSPESTRRISGFSLRKFSRKVARLARPPSTPPVQPQGSISPQTLELKSRVMF